MGGAECVRSNSEPPTVEADHLVKRRMKCRHDLGAALTIALLKSGEFDVLLVDDYLPDLHSGDFLTQVAMLPIQPGIVVMQAAVPTADQLLQYASLGTSVVVPKHHLAQVCKAVATCCVAEPLANAGVN